MFNLSKLAIVIALFCAPGLAQTSSPESQPAPADTASTEQSSYVAKPEEYSLDLIETAKATYPPAAKKQKIQGQVVGTILVSESGSVERVRFKGDPLLTAAAEEAAKKWKFKPVVNDGKTIQVMARATFNFVLPDDLEDTKEVAAELDQIRSVPQRVRISQGVSAGLLVHRVQPDYPLEARHARIEGTVLLRAVIGEDGSIKKLTLVSGHPMLAPAAIDAVQRWRYRPYLLLGSPVQVDTEILVNFQLR